MRIAHVENASAPLDDDSVDISALLKMGPMAPISNTHATYAALRNNQPVLDVTKITSGNSPESKTFLITRYADVKHVLKDDVTYSSDITQSARKLLYRH